VEHHSQYYSTNTVIIIRQDGKDIWETDDDDKKFENGTSARKLRKP
jgi:hypothetical protein